MPILFDLVESQPEMLATWVFTQRIPMGTEVKVNLFGVEIDGCLGAAGLLIKFCAVEGEVINPPGEKRPAGESVPSVVRVIGTNILEIDECGAYDLFGATLCWNVQEIVVDLSRVKVQCVQEDGDLDEQEVVAGVPAWL